MRKAGDGNVLWHVGLSLGHGLLGMEIQLADKKKKTLVNHIGFDMFSV